MPSQPTAFFILGAQKTSDNETIAPTSKRTPAQKWQRSKAGFEILKIGTGEGGGAELGGGVKICYEHQK